MIVHADSEYGDAIEPGNLPGDPLSPIERFKQTMSNTSWQRCPACGEEFNRLESCRFFLNGHPAESALCALCARTPRAFVFIATTWPISGVTVDVRWFSRAYKLPEDSRSERDRYAIVSAAGRDFIVTAISTGVRVKDSLDKEKPRDWDSSLMAWSWIRKRLSEPEPEIEKPRAAVPRRAADRESSDFWNNI